MTERTQTIYLMDFCYSGNHCYSFHLAFYKLDSVRWLAICCFTCWIRDFSIGDVHERALKTEVLNCLF